MTCLIWDELNELLLSHHKTPLSNPTMNINFHLEMAKCVMKGSAHFVIGNSELKSWFCNFQLVILCNSKS